MRSALTIFTTALIVLLFSCRRDEIDSPQQQDEPKLRRTVVKDSADKIIRIVTYSKRDQLDTDSVFQNGSLIAWTLNEYNSKGKRTKSTLWAPVFNPSGHHWMDISEYKDDTLLIISRHFLRDNQTLLTKHFYNASKQLILDSNYHTAVGSPVSTPYIRAYTYDAQGRLLTNTRLNELNDSVNQSSYQYFTNRTEMISTNWSYNPNGRWSSLFVTEYTATGKVLSEKTFSPLTQLSSQTDYTYDVSGNLIKTVTTNLSNTWENRYTNNAITGKPEKMHSYYQNRLSSTTFYYYE
jgi:hypothetical protein